MNSDRVIITRAGADRLRSELKRLKSVGHGESKPLDKANTKAAYAKNRRVEFHIEKRAEFADEIK